VLGRNLTYKARKLLGWLGVDNIVIEQINLESLRHKSIHGLLEDSQRTIKKVEIKFEKKELPRGLELVTKEHPELLEYIQRRHIPLDYPYMTDPDNKRPGILVPFTYKGMMVGSAIRFLDDRTPKYINDIQSGYVFGVDLQQTNWQYVIVTEGVFDALCINGLAVLHNDINAQQVEVIKSLEKQIIVVPDQDEAGMKLVDRAVELGWAVSIPEWPKDCKDINDAVIRLGRLGTLLTILEHKETSKIKIEMRKKKIIK
jgi:nitrogen fixation protein